MKTMGCLALLAVLGWFALEAWVAVLLGRTLSHHYEAIVGSGGVLLVFAWMAVAAVIGIRLARYHIGRIAPGVLNGTAGRHVIGLVGAVLLAVPGLMTDVPGLLLLLPPVQRLLSKVGAALVAVVVKRTMGRMFGGQGGGFPGFGGGGFAGSPFPGMKPLTPDDRASMFTPSGRKSPRTIDVSAEKD